jgi:hypothetical protein
MNSRRRMGLPRPWVTPYHIVVGNAALCITANLAADVADGSFTTEAVEATRACMSAFARKRTNGRSCRYVRFVPIATERSAAKNRYSVTSSARASNAAGTISPSTCAVVKFITRSNVCISGYRGYGELPKSSDC